MMVGHHCRPRYLAFHRSCEAARPVWLQCAMDDFTAVPWRLAWSQGVPWRWWWGPTLGTCEGATRAMCTCITVAYLLVYRYVDVYVHRCICICCGIYLLLHPYFSQVRITKNPSRSILPGAPLCGDLGWGPYPWRYCKQWQPMLNRKHVTSEGATFNGRLQSTFIVLTSLSDSLMIQFIVVHTPVIARVFLDLVGYLLIMDLVICQLFGGFVGFVDNYHRFWLFVGLLFAVYCLALLILDHPKCQECSRAFPATCLKADCDQPWKGRWKQTANRKQQQDQQ